MQKDDKLLPAEKGAETREARVEEKYRQAQKYFRESFFQALKTNAALLTVLVLFVAKGLRYAWESVRRYFPWRR